MKKINLIILTIFLAYLVNGCSSPMDVRTPRDTVPINGENYKMPAKISDLLFVEDDSIVKHFNTLESTVSIDTTNKPPRLWLKLVLEDTSNASSLIKRITTRRLDINLDSIDFSRRWNFSGRHTDINWAQLKVERGLNTSNDTIIVSGSEANLSDISFTLDKGIAYASFNASIFDKKVWKEYHDSTYTQYITVTRYDTTFDNNGKMIITIVTEKVPKEITEKIEEEKRMKDSLFLKGKFKLSY